MVSILVLLLCLHTGIIIFLHKKMMDKCAKYESIEVDLPSDLVFEFTRVFYEFPSYKEKSTYTLEELHRISSKLKEINNVFT